MPAESTAAFGAWCAMKSSFPSEDDILRLRDRNPSGTAAVLRGLSLPDDYSSLFVIEGILLERYSSAVRSISHFFSSEATGVFIRLLEEFDWWNIMFLVKLSISRRKRALIGDMLFMPPSSTTYPPDISSLNGTGDMEKIIGNYSAFFPEKTRVSLSSDGMTAEAYHSFEYLVSALKLARLHSAANSLEMKYRREFHRRIETESNSLLSAISSSRITLFLSDAISYLKPVPHDRIPDTENEQPDTIDFNSPFARFDDLMNTRLRITRFCASLGRMKHHALS